MALTITKKFNVEVVQVFKVTRRIIVTEEAEDAESAVEQIASGDVPEAGDPRWKDMRWSLENEEVYLQGTREWNA